MSKFTKYVVVYEKIKREITDGIIEPNSFLPTEQELMEIYQVSRTTIRKAIQLLKDEGYLEVRQGRGTKVVNIGTTQKLARISSISETLTNDGHVVSVKSMSIVKTEAPPSIQSYFPAGTEVYCLERILCSDGAPIVYSTTYLLASKLPGFENFENKFTGLYHFIENQYNIHMTDALETLSASSATFTESQLLNIPLGSPLLISKRLTNIGTELFEYGINRLVGNRYKYSIYLQGR